jgi:small multidrug resistance pump
MWSWVYLSAAILLEVSGTVSMKFSQGFSRLWPTVAMFVFYGLSLAAMNLALKQIEVSIVYAVWSGVGTALISAIGIFWFREPVTALKMVSIFLIIIGVIGLNLKAGGIP